VINSLCVFLVVDDFEPMQIVTSNQLRSMGAKIILIANNGAEALRILKSRRIDMILSDWNMPVMTGMELLKAVRSNNTLSHLPFIMITAEAERHRIEDAIASGVSELLVKPYTADCFQSHIEKALTSGPRSRLPVRLAPRVNQEVMEISDEQEERNIGTTSQTLESNRPTILVVDDTPDNLMLLSQLFKDEYRVRIAHTGEKALAICQSDNPPELVLLDIMMPGMDGFEVAGLMRQHPTSKNIPVIFITAMTGEEARHKGLELGAIDFINKPIDPDVLKPRVRNFMRYVELHKQLQANYDSMLELARLQENVESITRHDMKGSLAGVIGLVQGLAEDDLMNRKQVTQLRLAEETALQVINMINLSSEIFKIETGRFELDAKAVNISYVLHRIVEISRTSFAEKHLIVAIDTDMPVGEEIPNVFGDAMLCYSIFQNLIKNACEASPSNGRVTVKLIGETPLRIIIRNKGVVPSEIRDRFFDKFVTHGKLGGNGIGTYSAKMLAEAQNGTISLAVSDLENETTISVTLPRYTEAAT